MGLKKFKSDVSMAAQKATKVGFAGVIFVGHGESDGEVVIKYRNETLPGDVRIQALAQDVSEYPDGNMFMLWTDEADPPPPVVAAIEAVQDYLLGMSVCEMVSEVATRVEKEIARTTKGGNSESQIADIERDDVNDDSNSNENEDDASDYDAAYDEDFSSDGEEFGLPSLPGRRHFRQNLESAEGRKPLLRRIRRDLRRVEQAGFKVGLLDGFGKTSTTGHASISIRVDKLALSNEAMEAWNLRPAEYVVLILRFERPYNTLERILQQAAAHTKADFRIGRCSTYKPSLSQALVAFSESNCAIGTASSSSAGQGLERGSGSFEKLFLSNSLDQFLCESFVSLLKLRGTYGINWEQANEFLLSRIGLVTEDQRLAEPRGFGNSSPDPDASPERYPVQNQDHLLEKGFTSERSFPLIAMQFAMHYFVKCTKYCLRCHRRLENGFEALRPYVCSDPLCLFQYMAMGFGPSIEHEILAEPYVVDLLVSLCYAAIQPYSSTYLGGVSGDLPIRTLPVGLRLRVPNLASEVSDFLKAKVSADNTRLLFEAEGAKILGERLAPMKWLAFRRPGQTLTQHVRIHEVNSAAKTVHIEVMSQSAAAWGKKVHAPMSSTLHSPTPGSVQSDDGIVEVFLYDIDFDSLDDNSKAVAMRHALDTLPPIAQIRGWLISHPHNSFRSMEGISPAAASLLQWIVSSNRSCIFQVDRPQDPSREGNEDSGAVGGRNREHERILGMDGWVQFRFAQGSPDKELRFNRALQEVAARKGLQAYPTIFAWHGSNLANWHSIVRTGLDFKDIRCGRAFGHGVYFSRQASTSMGYSAAGAHPWPGSALNITSCLSLNEIINAPDEFVSREPHYVVSQLDWHQCRYLFVQTPPAGVQSGGWWHKVKIQQSDAAKQKASNQESHQEFHQQAPGSEAYGQTGKPLQIPVSAIPLRTVGPAAAPSPSSPSKRTVERLEDSADEHTDEAVILFTDTDDESDVAQGPPRKKPASLAPGIDTTAGGLEIAGDGPPTPCSTSRSLTDFEPGSLDLSSLPRLAPPSFATYAATKALSGELKRLQAVQANTPLHELGWYIDFDQVTNLFQWIVQLHSFDESLPLAKDMKSAGVISIVLELRFSPDFPFSPPFVRVVRPRFLPFGVGGGGHVTVGGAMCMELLTSSGWSPASSMESVLLQVRMALCNLEPRPARLDPAVRSGKNIGDYAVGEAIDAYIRAVNAHGWTVPKDLRVTALGV